LNGDMPGASCPTALPLNVFDGVNDPVNLHEDVATEANPVNLSASRIYYCEGMVQPCGPTCVQQASTLYYSCVFAAHINQDNLQADHDPLKNNLYIPSNYDGGTTQSDV